MTIISQTKKTLLTVMVFIFAGPQTVFAQSSDMLSDLFACEQVIGDAAQLACFRAETAKIKASDIFGDSISTEKENLANERARLVLERQRLAAERESLADAKTPAFNEDFAEKPKAPKSQTVAITKTETLGASGYIRFTLANGEVWQQTEAERVRLGRASPDMLVVTKGRVGGYFGKVNDRRPSFRVKQVK